MDNKETICLKTLEEAQKHMIYLMSLTANEDQIEAYIGIHNSLEKLKKYAS